MYQNVSKRFSPDLITDRLQSVDFSSGFDIFTARFWQNVFNDLLSDRRENTQRKINFDFDGHGHYLREQEHQVISNGGV